MQENVLDIKKQHGQYDIKPQVYEKAEIKEEDIEMFDPYDQEYVETEPEEKRQNLHWKLGQLTPSFGYLLAYLETMAKNVF